MSHVRAREHVARRHLDAGFAGDHAETHGTEHVERSVFCSKQ
jgi:hypothetical protein